jgi:hypothetical protein
MSGSEMFVDLDSFLAQALNRFSAADHAARLMALSLPPTEQQEFIRGDLFFARTRVWDEPMLLYRPASQPLTVDDMHYYPGRYSAQTMLSLRNLEGSGSARMQHNSPPTEEELDLWVAEGTRFGIILDVDL